MKDFVSPDWVLFLKQAPVLHINSIRFSGWFCILEKVLDSSAFEFLNTGVPKL